MVCVCDRSNFCKWSTSEDYAHKRMGAQVHQSGKRNPKHVYPKHVIREYRSKAIVNVAYEYNFYLQKIQLTST